MKCDRCGKNYEIKTWKDDMQIQTYSPKGIEEIWIVCSECYAKLINFMENKCNRAYFTVMYNEEM